MFPRQNNNNVLSLPTIPPLIPSSAIPRRQPMFHMAESSLRWTSISKQSGKLSTPHYNWPYQNNIKKSLPVALSFIRPLSSQPLPLYNSIGSLVCSFRFFIWLDFRFSRHWRRHFQNVVWSFFVLFFTFLFFFFWLQHVIFLFVSFSIQEKETKIFRQNILKIKLKPLLYLCLVRNELSIF